MSMETKKYQYVNFSNEIHEDIVFSSFPENLQVNIDVVKEIVASRINFTQNKKKFHIVDINNIKQISSEAKHYAYNSPEGLDNVYACAIIANIPTSTLLANVLIKTPSNIPFKLFTNKDSAISWINELKEQRISSR